MAVFLLLLILGGYVFEWTGFGESVHRLESNEDLQRAKTLWDWLDLLIVPVIVALGGALLTSVITQRTRIAEEMRARGTALSEYLVQMERLLTEKGLRDSEGDDPVSVRASARALTLTVLQSLAVGGENEDPGADRRSEVLRFLREAHLIEEDPSGEYPLIIPLAEANLRYFNLIGTRLNRINLSRVDLKGAKLTNAILDASNLNGADLTDAILKDAKLIGAKLGPFAGRISTKLKGANLEGAVLLFADLTIADLTKANLTGANLTGANLRGAILSGANLTGATVTQEQLGTCRSLVETIMPDGTKREQ